MRHLWKVYFWIWAGMHLLIYPLWLIAEGTLPKYIDAAVSLLALLGIYGFAYKKKIFNPLFWRIGFFLFIGWDIFYNLQFTNWSHESEYFNKYGFLVACNAAVSLTLTFTLISLV